MFSEYFCLIRLLVFFIISYYAGATSNALSHEIQNTLLRGLNTKHERESRHALKGHDLLGIEAHFFVTTQTEVR